MSLEVLAHVAELLDRLGIPYVVGGSIASMQYGALRMTLDADVVIDLRPEHVDPLTDALSSEFYVDRMAMREALHERRSFNAIHLESLFKIDFFVTRTGPFDRSELSRAIARPGVVPGAPPIRFKTAEDVLLRKLLWFREGGESSEQQWKDVLSLLAVQRGRLDEEYLGHWADEIGVADLLTRARAATL
jgi:hypothetical protein